MRVAILGFGPSALFSILACNDYGISPTVMAYGFEEPAVVGCFFYHWVPTWISEMVGTSLISVFTYGNEKTYIRKQWGEMSGITSSFNKYTGKILGYNPSAVNKSIIDICHFEKVKIFKEGGFYLSDVCNKFDYVIQTFPTEFSYNTRPPLVHIPVSVQESSDPSNFIVYSGLEGDKWVRTSNLFGNRFTEYPPNFAVSSGDVVVIKDMYPNVEPYQRCGDDPHNLYLVGRFAQWKRTMLAHEAYGRVQNILKGVEK